MHLHTTGVLDLLSAKTGRYIEHHHGLYVMKEGDGSNVFVLEDGKHVHIEPSDGQMNDLLTAGHLVQEGSRYQLP
jgi:hypothetical protein